jgi:ABC-type sugar transport system permease subunit
LQKKLFWTGIIFITPISLILFVFLVLPIIQSFYYSITDWRGIGPYQFIGLDNYVDIFQNSLFISTMNRTLYIGLTTALLANIIGLLIAVMLDQSLKSQNFLRVLFYLPNVIPIVVAAFVWRFMLDANNGLINVTLSKILNDTVRIPWIDSPDYVVNSIIGISVWAMMGPIIIIYIAALQSVPLELKDAAMIDGANSMKRFFNVTIPMIAPGITVNILIGLVNGIRIFDLPFALTGGGPANASETLAIRIYYYAFQSAELSYGMAASFVLTMIAMVITYFFVAVSRQYEKGAQAT